MGDLRKYATATHYYMPMVKRAVVDFAVGADWTPAAGDVKISIDGGAFANVTNLPTAIASANTGADWDFSLTSAELTGKKIKVIISDAPTKAVEDNAFELLTYGHASAEIPFDLSSATVDVGKWAGTTVGLSALGIASIGILDAGAAGGFTLPAGQRDRVFPGMILWAPTKGAGRYIASADTTSGVGTPDTDFSPALAASDPYVVFTQASPLAALAQVNVKAVNDVTLQGDGTSGNPWRPA